MAIMKKTMIRVCSILLCVLMLVGSAPAAGLAGMANDLSVTAAAESSFGMCGDNAHWTLDPSAGILTISGTGAMTNFENLDTFSYQFLKFV